MERDRGCKMDWFSLMISTHTLTWSVTALSSVLTVFTVISTHTLTWSVTLALIDIVVSQRISTHTLTWSVTTA